MSNEDKIWGAVKDAWQAALPSLEFDPDGSLSDLGIDSLKAMELVLRIERWLDRSVPIAILGPETTPRSLVAALQVDAGLQTRPQLFFMPGIAGPDLNMARCWQAIVEELSLSVVDTPDLNRSNVLLSDLRATALEVIGEITRRQPTGDIQLMGYSYGAALAYEVATQFQTRGRRITFLGLIDLIPNRGFFLRLGHVLRSPDVLWRKFANRIPRLSGTGHDPAISTWLIQAAIHLDARGVASKLARLKAEREGLDVTVADRLEIHHLRAQALRRWRPTPIDVPALLIASDDGVLAGSPSFWQSQIAGLKVVCVPGSHQNLAAIQMGTVATQPLRAALALPH